MVGSMLGFSLGELVGFLVGGGDVGEEVGACVLSVQILSKFVHSLTSRLKKPSHSISVCWIKTFKHP